MILDKGESGVLLDPKIYLLKLDDEESSLKWGELWWSDYQENILVFLVFESVRELEDRISSEVFLLMILWKEKSKFLLCPEIFFELDYEIEVRWLELVFKACKDLVGRLNEGSRSYLGWVVNLEEEEWARGWWMLVTEIRLEDLSFNTDRN